jgi:hypothetical protein
VRTSGDYRIANVVGLVSCVDSEASSLDLSEDGAILFADRLVRDVRRARGLPLFRLAEHPATLMLHDSLKRALEQGHISGVEFLAPEQVVI